uniref:Nucleoprotein n=9 Tax=Dugbe virus TaxID=3052514 RepID=B8XQX4_DUGBV|nr:nucleocapsid [Orthonairovirus dugbeense]
MENQIKANNKKEFDEWFKPFSDKLQLRSTLTNSASLCDKVPDLALAEMKMALATDDKEKDSIFSNALVEATRFCAPIYECAWTCSTGVVQKSLSWFDKNKDFIKLWDAKYMDLRKGIPEPEQLVSYQQAAQKWRKDIGYEINQFTRSLTHPVVAEYKVPGEIAVDVKEMLSDMIRRRNVLLNGDGENAGKKGPISREHVSWGRELAEGKFQVVFNPPWGDINKCGKSGIPLAATAMVKVAELDGSKKLEDIRQALLDLKKWVEDNKDALEDGKGNELIQTMTKHLAQAVELSKKSNALRAQGAQIDTPFSAFYWAWSAGVKPETFFTLSQFLFEMGQSARGGKKMIKALTSTPLRWGKGLINLFADDDFSGNRLYMHPAVLTPGRMSEMGACFGVIPVASPEDAILGSGHSKNILNFKIDTSVQNPCASTIVQLYRIQKSGFDLESLEVVSTEHLLHQSFVGKRCPTQNAYKVRGNATNVNII